MANAFHLLQQIQIILVKEIIINFMVIIIIIIIIIIMIMMIIIIMIIIIIIIIITITMMIINTNEIQKITILATAHIVLRKVTVTEVTSFPVTVPMPRGWMRLQWVKSTKT